MGLSVLNFFKLTPKIPYLFAVTFNFGDEEKSNFTYHVQSVKMPTIDSGDEIVMYLGNEIINVPTFNPASRTLEITFEEDNGMNISKLLSKISYIQYNGINYPIGITVTDYQNSVNTSYKSRYFICHLKNFDNAQFSNSGSANVCTISASFIVLAELTAAEYNKLEMANKFGKQRDDEIAKLNNSFDVPAPERPSNNLADYGLDGESLDRLRTGTNLNQPGSAGRQGANDHKQWTPKKSGTGTKDFSVSDKEAKQTYDALKKKYKKFNMSEKEFKSFLDNNAANLKKRAETFYGLLEQHGFAFAISDVNSSNDTHKLNLNSNSGVHELMHKFDAFLLHKNENGNHIRLGLDDMNKNTRDLIHSLADQAGLNVNIEFGPGGMWLDLSSKKSKMITAEGEIVDKSFTSWVGKDEWRDSRSDTSHKL